MDYELQRLKMDFELLQKVEDGHMKYYQGLKMYSESTMWEMMKSNLGTQRDKYWIWME